MTRSRTARTVAAASVAAAVGLVVAAPAVFAQPAPTEVQRQVLTTEVADPTALDVAQDGSVFVAERRGAVKVWRQDGTLVHAGTIPTSANSGFTDASGELEEGGLHGLLLDRDFATSRRVFLYRTLPKSSVNPVTREGLFRLSSFVVRDDFKLDLSTERTVLEVPAEWDYCCHYGGDMHWDEKGAILLSVGDDTSPRQDSYGPRDNRPGREAFNAERTSQNPGDRRGKILRLLPDGTVPPDNPHVDDPAYDPYVYAMGFRSNYRFSYDAVTGQAFVGNVGPDANTDDRARGPQGYDELEVVPAGGGTNHGWPRCIGPNRPYLDYDYVTGSTGGELSCEGMTPAVVYYRNVSTDFPQMAAGFGATIMAGPVYRYAGDGALALPDSFNGRLIFSDWSRSVMYTIGFGSDGATLDPATIAPFSVGMPATFVSVVPSAISRSFGGPGQPISTAVGPDGALYVAEYGSGYYANTDSKISRLVCAGCKPSASDYEPLPSTAAVAPAVPDVAELGLPDTLGGDGEGREVLGIPLSAAATASAFGSLAAAGIARRRRLF